MSLTHGLNPSDCLMILVRQVIVGVSGLGMIIVVQVEHQYSVKNWKSISKLLKMCAHPFIGSCSYGVSMFSKFLNLDELYCLQS